MSLRSPRTSRALALTPLLLSCGALTLIACETETAPQKPPVVMPPRSNESPKWLTEASARCALAASCAHEHDPARFSDPSACVAAFGQRLARGEKDTVYQCLGAAKTCDAVSACLRDGDDPRAVRYCTAHPGVLSACDGDYLVACGGDDTGESVSVNCGEMGARCNESSAGGLIVRACFSPKLCPTTGARCESDTTLISCHDGAVEKITCGAGTKCQAHTDVPGEGAASCEPTSGVRCTELDGKRCDGDKLVECVSKGHGGRVRVTDCGAVGLRCAGRGARAGCYVGGEVACDAAPATCEGDSLSFCANGRMTRVSCTQLGLSACSPAANGPNAACVVPKERSR
jgi:hypothetical protein